MSDPVRVAFVTEGPTDLILLTAAVRALLGGRDFEQIVLQPLMDESLRATNKGGWGGVYVWCRQVVDQAAGPAGDHPLFATGDTLVVIQVDADVARAAYKDYHWIKNTSNDDLPCEKPCPPASATTDALRTVVLGWLGEKSVPSGAVLCIPSKSIETWLLVGLFPENEQVAKPNVECRWGLEVQLRRHGFIKGTQKLIGQYQANEGNFQDAWGNLRKKCGEAERFSQEFLAAVPRS